MATLAQLLMALALTSVLLPASSHSQGLLDPAKVELSDADRAVIDKAVKAKMNASRDRLAVGTIMHLLPGGVLTEADLIVINSALMLYGGDPGMVIRKKLGFIQ